MSPSHKKRGDRLDRLQKLLKDPKLIEIFLAAERKYRSFTNSRGRKGLFSKDKNEEYTSDQNEKLMIVTGSNAPRHADSSHRGLKFRLNYLSKTLDRGLKIHNTSYAGLRAKQGKGHNLSRNFMKHKILEGYKKELINTSRGSNPTILPGKDSYISETTWDADVVYVPIKPKDLVIVDKQPHNRVRKGVIIGLGKETRYSERVWRNTGIE